MPGFGKPLFPQHQGSGFTNSSYQSSNAGSTTNHSSGYSGPRNWQETKALIKLQEGRKPNVYNCSLGFPTLGYGHKVTEAEKDRWKLGTPVSDEVAARYFDQDFPHAKESVQKRYPHYPEEVQFIIANMTFQMGNAGVANFKKMHEALEREDYEGAAKEMENSKWYRDQTQGRAKTLIQHMRSLKPK